MNAQTFESICLKLHDRRTEIVDAKRPEYTEGNADVLHNFKTVARELGLDPLQVWYVYFRKHIASIGQYCANPSRATAEPIDSRFADSMNYLELGLALIIDVANEAAMSKST